MGSEASVAARSPNAVRGAPRRDAAAMTVLFMLGLLVAVPVMTVLQLGGSPYEDLRRGYPGLDVTVAVACMRALAEVSGLVTVGALVVLLFVGGAGRDLPEVARCCWRCGSGRSVGRPALACWWCWMVWMLQAW